MCMAKDRDLEDLWSPMVGASADKVLVFVRMLGAPSRGGSSEPIDCTVAEWSYPDPAVDLTRRAAPAMGSGGAQDLPDRGPAIVYCSLYAAVRYVNEVVQADSEVRINMAAGVYHVGSKTLPPITRRTPLFIYGASKRGRTRELPSLECAGEAKDGRKPLPFQRDIEGEYSRPADTGMSSYLEPGSPGWKSGTGVKYVLTTILRTTSFLNNTPHTLLFSPFNPLINPRLSDLLRSILLKRSRSTRATR